MHRVLYFNVIHMHTTKFTIIIQPQGLLVEAQLEEIE